MKTDIPRLIRALFGIPEPRQESLKNFATFAELEAWFQLHDELRLPSPNLCDDYSEESWRLAEEDGYRLSDCLVKKGMAWQANIFTKPDGSVDESVNHIANAARVLEDASYWYVDLGWNKLVKLCNFHKGGKY